MQTVQGMVAAQKLLKANGYVLLAFGPHRVTFHHQDAKTDERDRLPRTAILKMTGTEFKQFSKTLKQ